MNYTKEDYHKIKATPSPFSTRVWLCKTNLDITSGHQFYFKTEEEKIEYFTNQTRSRVVGDMKYIRSKSGELNLDIPIVELLGNYNYLVFVNPAHESKYYFCNILDFVYVSERVTSVQYSIDNWITYQHDLDFSKDNFIVRRHFNKNEYYKIANLPYEDLDRGRNNVLATETIHKVNGD